MSQQNCRSIDQVSLCENTVLYCTVVRPYCRNSNHIICNFQLGTVDFVILLENLKYYLFFDLSHTHHVGVGMPHCASSPSLGRGPCMYAVFAAVGFVSGKGQTVDGRNRTGCTIAPVHTIPSARRTQSLSSRCCY